MTNRKKIAAGIVIFSVVGFGILANARGMVLQTKAGTAKINSNSSNNAAKDIREDSNSDYELIMSLKTPGYQDLTVKEFNQKVKIKLDNNQNFLEIFNKTSDSITEADEGYSFIHHTLALSTNEVTDKIFGEEKHGTTFNVLNTSNLLNEDADGIKHYLNVTFTIEYNIPDESALTVKERDSIIMAYKKGIQDKISEIAVTKLLDKDAVISILEPEMTRLTEALESDKIIVEGNIGSVEIPPI